MRLKSSLIPVPDTLKHYLYL